MHNIRIEKENWVKGHEKQLFVEVLSKLDPKKEHIKKISIDYSAIHGSWESAGDAGGIPYPYNYWLFTTAYVNDDKNYQLKINIQFDKTKGNRIFKTRINPFTD